MRIKILMRTVFLMGLVIGATGVYALIIESYLAPHCLGVGFLLMTPEAIANVRWPKKRGGK